MRISIISPIGVRLRCIFDVFIFFQILGNKAIFSPIDIAEHAETNDAGDPEQIFSTEESIADRSHRIVHKQRSIDECGTNRPNEDRALGSVLAIEDARGNLTDEINDQLAAAQMTDDTNTPMDSLVYDFDSIPTVENKDCDYLKLVLGFKRTLVLPDVFFASETPICYCALCVSCARSSILKGLSHFNRRVHG